MPSIPGSGGSGWGGPFDIPQFMRTSISFTYLIRNPMYEADMKITDYIVVFNGDAKSVTYRIENEGDLKSTIPQGATVARGDQGISQFSRSPESWHHSRR